ncbi:MAG: hypothetical protein R3F62_21285 [Planctomycetota bacterium]
MADLALAEERRRLRASCRHLPGHGPAHPAHALEQAAAWIREHDPAPDSYGAGAVLEDFEREVAGLLGFAAARFMPSGCMAQPIALRIWSARAGIPVTAFHATSHLELHEEHGYREGAARADRAPPGRPQPPDPGPDLDALLAGPARESGLASLLVELPAREIGGQLPSWDELVELSAAAASAGCACTSTARGCGRCPRPTGASCARCARSSTRPTCPSTRTWARSRGPCSSDPRT